ncbi:penicillin-binding protein [Ruminococcaceae bacterium OttesenSCG-928-N02]|nr:penicillin-binding protein [Ruminococcaceae bacterium OttesenSCG-928-N02]
MKQRLSTPEGRKEVLKSIGFWLGIMVCVGVMVMSVFGVGLTIYLVRVTENDDMMLNLSDIKLSFTTILYAQDEQTGEWVEYQRLGSQEGGESRVWVDLGDMNEYLPQAFIAVEDQTFYEHDGVNWKRSFSALLNSITTRLGMPLYSSMQGASTITQQLIKNLTGDEEQDAMRKFREMYRAIVLENQYSKDLILEAYLNVLRLTGQIAGVQAGANTYFGVDVLDLSIAQCASLAAITKNPYAYNPYTFPEEHLTRRDYIIGLMYNQGMITLEQRDEARAEPLGLVESTNTGGTGSRNTWFTDTVIEEVVTDLMAEYNYTRAEATSLLYNGGLRIYTTVVPSLQTAMEEVMEEATMFSGHSHTYTVIVDGETVEREEGAQAAMISLTYDGGVAAVAGGIGPKEVDRGLNRAYVPRQTGSSMKPIAAYVLGIEYEYITMSSTFVDSPLMQIRDDKTGQLRDWPANYSQHYEEIDILVNSAIARSLNTIAVKVGNLVGSSTMYDFLEGTLGITSLVESGPTNDKDLAPLVLGALTEGISPAEMAGAYLMFGNGGIHYAIHSYTTVENASGEVILDKTVTRTQAISEETAAIMLKMLQGVLQGGGTGSGLAPRYMAAAGKTGTTSDNKDHWFVGLTPYYVTATWWGFDHPDFLTKFSFATHPPTTAWRAVMNAAQENLEWRAFPVCRSLVELAYCADSGDLAGGACPTHVTGYYRPNKVPGSCILHG